ncbi:flagellar hook-associated protein FlgL [Nocardioides sp. TRM66260-LWL]|uniref:flagellar hook-associated protein FlgL n=1 Tax=Nocardioides sp. TRM66260-LWL TaxID=2874478 RepID=UPI001CC543D3|nr:flagellar hook-associated protein FlgL [Nocardioides sp. TRM66260-LWL]MBZ5736155.1 flagellar hook-associated protein FlgL [Nocardioides sp. TRM66260-LWL]
MSTVRVTQPMMVGMSLRNLQSSLSKYNDLQERLSTGKVVNRASDSPTDATASMRTRVAIADTQRYVRNADNGIGWLNTADTTLSTMGGTVRRARELALQGASTGSSSQAARESLAVEVDQLRQDLISQANTTYVGRPIFGGTTSGSAAFDTATGAYIGDSGQVTRTIADGVQVRVDVPGLDVIGPNGASIFDDLANLSTALRAGDQAGMQTGLAKLSARQSAITTAQATVGAAYNRVEGASQKGKDALVALRTNLSEVEDADLPKTLVDLQMQQVAYQAALSATAKVMQPSLIDFLR